MPKKSLWEKQVTNSSRSFTPSWKWKVDFQPTTMERRSLMRNGHWSSRDKIRAGSAIRTITTRAWTKQMPECNAEKIGNGSETRNTFSNTAVETGLKIRKKTVLILNESSERSLIEKVGATSMPPMLEKPKTVPV